MDIVSRDLNLLVLFDILMSERSVSAAAKRLHLSQSAASHALARLRLAFGDELFVRTARGVTPTPQALALAPAIADTLTRARAVFASPGRFDPATAEGRLTLASTEFFEHLVLPKLVPALGRASPRLQLRSRSGLGQLPKAEMERGDIDVAVAGFFGELPEGFHKEVIFEDHFVCVVRQNHRYAQEKLTLAAYLELEHLLVSPQGDLVGVVDRELAKKKMQRRIVAGISNFLTPGLVVAASDMIVTIPSRIAALYVKEQAVTILDLPLEVPGITLIQVWHERTNGDALQVWFRQLMREATL